MKPFIPFPFPLPFLHFFPLLIPLLPQVLFLLPDFPRLLFAADADGFHDEEFSFVRMFHAGFAFQISVGRVEIAKALGQKRIENQRKRFLAVFPQMQQCVLQTSRSCMASSFVSNSREMNFV